MDARTTYEQVLCRLQQARERADSAMERLNACLTRQEEIQAIEDYGVAVHEGIKWARVVEDLEAAGSAEVVIAA